MSSWTNQAYCYEGCGKFFTNVAETAQQAENATKAEINAHVQAEHDS